ncbi:MAG: alanine racemase [Patescibacteria group bacterium]|jgi:alanine racemase
MYSSWVEISKSAISYNLAQYQRIVGSKVAVMPIVKSNAYGHGMIQIAKLVSAKVKWLGVVNLGEALALRQNKIKNRIFVLSYCQSELLEEGIRQNIDLPVYDLAMAKLISKKTRNQKINPFDYRSGLMVSEVESIKKTKVHIKIDTGASRVGVLPKDAVNFIRQVCQLPNLKVEGIYSHFAASEENPKYTKWQLNNFNQVLANLKKEGINIPYKHFACSAAALVEPKSYFNLIRLGLGLYGLWPSNLAKKIAIKKYPWLKLKPALSWKTKIIQVKEISKDTKIGYGCTFIAKKKMKIAVLPVGYWEGYDRHLSNQGEVIIKNKKCPVIGRVCMNLTMVDVSLVKDVKIGDEVVLLGGGVPAEELAEKIRTINYEVVTRINPILERRYLK